MRSRIGDVEEVVALLEREALVVPGEAEVGAVIPDDPADERLLACAVEAEADCIVSGDPHLLGLGEYQGIPNSDGAGVSGVAGERGRVRWGMRMGRPIRWGLLVVLLLAGCGPSGKARVFEHEAFTFEIPAGWKTEGEVWGQSASTGEEYKGLGVREIVTVQYPARRGRGEAFFTVASSPLGEGENLESRFARAYEGAVPEIVDAVQRPFEQGELSGYEITCRRPWGEPWWQFWDIWVAKDGVVYSPYAFEEYSETL